MGRAAVGGRTGDVFIAELQSRAPADAVLEQVGASMKSLGVYPIDGSTRLEALCPPDLSDLEAGRLAVKITHELYLPIFSGGFDMTRPVAQALISAFGREHPEVPVFFRGRRKRKQRSESMPAPLDGRLTAQDLCLWLVSRTDSQDASEYVHVANELLANTSQNVVAVRHRLREHLPELPLGATVTLREKAGIIRLATCLLGIPQIERRVADHLSSAEAGRK